MQEMKKMHNPNKILVIILNKDNAKGLKTCIESLLNQTYNCFDILVLDGNSKDNSREVAEKYSINFKVQKKLGGTGFARVEGCMYALQKGYDVVVWGDSENVYHKDYMKKVAEKIRFCDVVGGIPILIGSFFDHAFAWYHAIHLIVPKLYKKHIPGNNKAEKIWIYNKIMYPESVRAEDYGFSLLLMKNRIKVKQCIANAFVEVSTPKNFKELIFWQNARAKGVAQALRLTKMKPYDILMWSFVFILLPLLSIMSIITPLAMLALKTYIFLLFTSSILIHIASKRFIKYFKWYYIVAPLFGLLIHSLYSIKSLVYYVKFKSMIEVNRICNKVVFND